MRRGKPGPGSRAPRGAVSPAPLPIPIYGYQHAPRVISPLNAFCSTFAEGFGVGACPTLGPKTSSCSSNCAGLRTHPGIRWSVGCNPTVAQLVKYPAWLFTVVLCGLSSCSAYDPSLVKTRTGDLGTGGAFGGTGGRSLGGGFGNAGNSGAFDEDAGIIGPDMGPRCGDGRVDTGEKCDTGIPNGAPGACPTTCQTPVTCQRFMIAGSGCQTECQLIKLGCVGGDGCCPADCDPAQDSDCSGLCGDRIVQPELGETCEDSNPDERCPTLTDCADENACTRDAISGSSENCNAACTHTPITSLQGGDGCCPAGADANTDSDCKARCGNGVREGSEACDGGTGCDAACKLTLTDTQVLCLATVAADDCERCACMQCTDVFLACSASGTAARDAKCTAVEKCAIANHCSGSACYCGDSSLFECGLRPNGPCRSVIEDAAGTSNGTMIENQRQDPNTALGRAQKLGDCRRAQCNAECP
jgi:hypothetical protein